MDKTKQAPHRKDPRFWAGIKGMLASGEKVAKEVFKMVKKLPPRYVMRTDNDGTKDEFYLEHYVEDQWQTFDSIEEAIDAAWEDYEAIYEGVARPGRQARYLVVGWNVELKAWIEDTEIWTTQEDAQERIDYLKVHHSASEYHIVTFHLPLPPSETGDGA